MQAPSRSVLAVTDNVPFGQAGQRSFFALTLERPDWAHWYPGQFVMLRPESWGAEITWARPFSICRVTPSGLVVFIQTVGRGTSLMAGLRAGDKVTLWGPLGTHFAVEQGEPTLLLAGGIGIAPFAGYVDRHPDPSSLVMLFGHRLPLDSYPAESLAQHIELESFHERTAGELEQFQRLLRERMEKYQGRDSLMLACGPLPFLHTVWRYAMELGARVQLSLDQRMACGVGACLGCVTRTSERWLDRTTAGLPVQTCTRGPVFWARELDLDTPVNQEKE